MVLYWIVWNFRTSMQGTESMIFEFNAAQYFKKFQKTTFGGRNQASGYREIGN